MTSNGTKQIKRKRSDPMFDNEEYLKQIEEKYMQQFEQSLLGMSVPSDSDSKPTVRSSKESIKDVLTQQSLVKDPAGKKSSVFSREEGRRERKPYQEEISRLIQKEMKPSDIDEKKKKKNRLGSDDKFDKKEYQEKIEQ